MQQGQGHQSTSLMLETYEACQSLSPRRPHLAQLDTAHPSLPPPASQAQAPLAEQGDHPQELGAPQVRPPSLSSSLLETRADPAPPASTNRTNADLQRQISLMRGERLALKGTHFQLECENAALRDRLDRADERERQLIDERDRLRQGPASSYDPDQVEVRSLPLALQAREARH